MLSPTRYVLHGEAVVLMNIGSGWNYDGFTTVVFLARAGLEC